jgi:hypothetical protein
VGGETWSVTATAGKTRLALKVSLSIDHDAMVGAVTFAHQGRACTKPARTDGFRKAAMSYWYRVADPST